MSGIFIIGEKINSSNPRVNRLLQERDGEALVALARAQVEGGASCIDLNASMLRGQEKDILLWSARCLVDRLGIDVSLDSPDIGLLLELVPLLHGRAILNSITGDERDARRATEVLASTDARLIVMLKNREGVPETARGRLQIAGLVASIVAQSGMQPRDVFFDPLFSTLATSPAGMSVALETLEGLRSSYPEFPRIGGLSNVSYGLPLRKLLNRTFLAMAVSHGLTAVICDPTDKRLREALTASEAIMGLDPGCRRLLRLYRDGGARS